MLTKDGVGRYRAPGLSLGRYELRAEPAGFQPKLRTGITLTVGGEALVDFSLAVGQLKAAVVVEDNTANVGQGIKISIAGARPNQNLFTLDGTASSPTR